VSETIEEQFRIDLLDILSKLVGLEPDKIKSADRLREDLGLDSLQSMELLSRISDKYELDLEVEDVMDVVTVDDVIKQLAELLRSGKPG
jgi:acyl carrier protein